MHVYTVDRAWLALEVTCKWDKEKGHTKSEVNRNIRVSRLSKSDRVKAGLLKLKPG